MKDTPTEATLPLVPETGKQGREIQSRRQWIEPAVWTERMLAALENGVRGGQWFSLIDKVFAPKNLNASWQRVRRNKGAAGVDGQTVNSFARNAESNLKTLSEQLRTETYRPQAVRRHWIPKPGSPKKRPLGIPTVRDRVVQGALRNVLEPIFERRFVEQSFGFRPGRGCHQALQRVEELLKAGFTHVVDADIESYFDRIDHELLMEEVRAVIADSRVLGLVQSLLEQRVMDGMSEWTPEEGTPQGAVISPLLANIHLHPIDIAIRTAGFEMVRYADDLLILCRDAVSARDALAALAAELEKRKLKLHPAKTRVVDASEPGGFDFLGYHFERDRKTPRAKSWMKFRDRIRELTPRSNGNSLACIVARLNPVLRGWYNYFKHCYPRSFDIADGFVRRRIRAILERRHNIKSRRGSRGSSNARWPNAFFAKHGLLSIAVTHAG